LLKQDAYEHRLPPTNAGGTLAAGNKGTMGPLLLLPLGGMVICALLLLLLLLLVALRRSGALRHKRGWGECVALATDPSPCTALCVLVLPLLALPAAPPSPALLCPPAAALAAAPRTTHKQNKRGEGKQRHYIHTYI
jgi:hypothetical protein